MLRSKKMGERSGVNFIYHSVTCLNNATRLNKHKQKRTRVDQGIARESKALAGDRDPIKFDLPRRLVHNGHPRKVAHILGGVYTSKDDRSSWSFVGAAHPLTTHPHWHNRLCQIFPADHRFHQCRVSYFRIERCQSAHKYRKVAKEGTMTWTWSSILISRSQHCRPSCLPLILATAPKPKPTTPSTPFLAIVESSTAAKPNDWFAILVPESVTES